MDKFLETQNLPRSTHEGIENLNVPTTSKETESVLKNLPAEVLDLTALIVNSTKHLKN